MKRLISILATALIALAGAAGTPAAERLTVMTSYPEAVVSRFEEAFERRHPEIRLQILWRMSHDALPYLSQPGQGGVDVYWTPSPHNFLALKAQGALGPLGIDRRGLPERIGDTAMVDPDGTFIATETAGYGLFVDPRRLAELGVAEPREWGALADPRLKGLVALPVPSQVGYAPMMIDQLLQHEGWQAGWATWRRVAANSRLIASRGQFVTDEVSEGRAAVGLTMDFFAASAVASGGAGRFIYPRHTAFNPAHVAITAATPRRPAAEAFVAFLLSAEGQRLLFHPAIRKLPVRPAVYADAPAGYTNPFALALETRYDPPRGLARRGFNNALFDAAITRHHAALAEAWALLDKAGEGAPPTAAATLEEARQALEALPVAEPAADDPLARACERRREEPAAEARCAAAEAEWDRFFDAHYAKARALAEQVLAGRTAGGAS